MNRSELKEYIYDVNNGLHKIQDKGNFREEVFYQPGDLIWRNELNGISDPMLREQRRNGYDTLAYFALHLSHDNHEIENDFAADSEIMTEVISYFSSEISNDLYLVIEKDTLHPIDVSYARTFGVSNSTSVMAVFDADVERLNANISFIFNDNLLGLGQNEFHFDTKDLKNTPTLIIN